jgi:Tol biopolymer transport system component
MSVATGGAQGNGDSPGNSISADGRYVAVYSAASNLVPGDTNGTYDIFVRDRQSGTTERVSIDSAGAQGNGDGADASISADGRYVAFFDNATNLVPGDTNGYPDIFVRDRSGGTSFTSLCDPGVGAGEWDSGVARLRRQPLRRVLEHRPTLSRGHEQEH